MYFQTINNWVRVSLYQLNKTIKWLSGVVKERVLNVSFPPHPKSVMALFLLDLDGVCCSSGSACSSGATLGSHVLRSLGFHEPSRVSLRFSFGRYNTEAEIDRALEAVSRVFAAPGA